MQVIFILCNMSRDLVLTACQHFCNVPGHVFIFILSLAVFDSAVFLLYCIIYHLDIPQITYRARSVDCSSQYRLILLICHSTLAQKKYCAMPMLIH